MGERLSLPLPLAALVVAVGLEALAAAAVAAGGAEGPPAPDEASPPAQAAPSAPAPAEPTFFDTVTVVAGAAPSAIRHVAGSVTVVDRAAIDERLAHDVADAVRGEPGVQVVADAGRFGATGFRIRGVEGNRVAIERDGVPLAEGFAVGSFSNAGRLAVDPEFLAAIETLRGPASALHAGDALGGVVAMRTLAAEELLLGGARRALRLRAGYDGRDRGGRLTVLAAGQAGERAGGGGGVLMLSRRAASERDNEGSVRPDPANRDRESWLAKWRQPWIAGRGALELGLDRQADRVRTDLRHLVSGPGQFATTESIHGDDRAARTSAWLEHAFAPAAAGRRLGVDGGELRVHWMEADTRQETEQRRRADRATPYPTRRDRRFDLAESLFGARATLRADRALGGVRHEVSWGASGSRERLRERRDGRETNLLTGAVTRTVIGERLPVRDFPPSTADRAAIFLADDLTLGPAGRWRVMPAVRWDRYRTRAEPDALFREDNPDFEAVEIDAAAWTRRLGVIRQFGAPGGAGPSVYLQWAEGFRAPPASDVNLGFTIPLFNYAAIPNPDLRPERSRGLEVGARYARGRSNYQVAVYDNRYRDLIESRANLGRDPVTGATRFQSVNRDRARIRGAEARARVHLGAWSTALDAWSLDASASFAEGRDLRRNQPLNTIDPANLRVAARWAPGGSSPWAAGLAVAWTASKEGEVDRTVAPVFATPSHTLVDLRVERRLGERAVVRVALENAFDRRYWSYAATQGVLATDPAPELFTQPGRSALVELQIGF